MRLMISNRAQGLQVRLGGVIQPADREEALEKLSASLEMGENIFLDLSGLTEIDTAALQILLCIDNEAKRQHKHLQYMAISAPVQQVFAALSLSQTFRTVDT